MSTTVEICVLGGGPAGSTIARQLVRLGHEVLLIESAEFPRAHPGESLSAGVLPLLENLGLRTLVEDAGLLQPHRLRARWGPSPEPTSNLASGFQVDRGEFDGLLLQAARAAGVQIWQPARAQRPARRAGAWQLSIDRAGQHRELRAHFLIDASGRRALLGGGRQAYAPATLALHGCWQNCPLAAEQTAILEAAPTHWLWGGPLPGRRFSCSIFLDRRHLLSAGKVSPEAAYRRLLAASESLRGCLQGRLVSAVAARDVTPTYATSPAGPTFLRVGDANFSIDPLATQGVQNALTGACQGSIVVHTLLTQPQNQAAALAFYQARQQEAVQQHRRTAAHFYAELNCWLHQPFWRERGQLSSPTPPRPSPAALPGPHDRVQLAPSCSLDQEPCLGVTTVSNQPVLRHPGLPRPVAYWNEIPLVPLLKMVFHRPTVAELVGSWAKLIATPQALGLFRWLWSEQVLVPASGEQVS